MQGEFLRTLLSQTKFACYSHIFQRTFLHLFKSVPHPWEMVTAHLSLAVIRCHSSALFLNLEARPCYLFLVKLACYQLCKCLFSSLIKNSIKVTMMTQLKYRFEELDLYFKIFYTGTRSRMMINLAASLRTFFI